MIYYKKNNIINKTSSQQLVTDTWLQPSNVRIARPFLALDDFLMSIDFLEIENNVSAFRFTSPRGLDTKARDLVLTRNVVFKNNTLSLIKSDNRCYTSRILDLILSQLENNDVVTIELTPNQLAFFAGILNIRVNNRTSSVLLKEGC